MRQGSGASYPTLQVTYTTSSVPYRIDIQQRINSGQAAAYTLRKFYNGLGQLIQLLKEYGTTESGLVGTGLTIN